MPTSTFMPSFTSMPIVSSSTCFSPSPFLHLNYVMGMSNNNLLAIHRRDSANVCAAVNECCRVAVDLMVVLGL